MTAVRVTQRLRAGYLWVVTHPTVCGENHRFSLVFPDVNLRVMSTINNTTHQSRRQNNVNHAEATATHRPDRAISGDDLPEYDTVIVQSDGSYQQDGHLAGVGFILKTRWGEIIHEEWGYAHNATTSMQTEATAMLRGVKAAKLFSPSYIIAYADCEPVVSRVNSNCPSGTPANRYVSINIELQHIDHVSVTHISREHNNRADTLAHKGLDKLREKAKRPGYRPHNGD